MSDESGKETSGADSVVRVDSLREAYAYVDAYPHASGPWGIVSETRSSRDGGGTMTLEIKSPDGDGMSVVFDISTFGASGGRQRFGVEPTTALDTLMSGVAEYVASNPPFHPGGLPRFPIPSLRYPGRVEVPIAILAAGDDGRPGLFAPARLVVVSLTDGKPYGIGEYPGFDPDQWPPERLGDWPPPATTALPRQRLAAMVARFNGVWLRLLEAATDNTTYPNVEIEKTEAQKLLALLETSGMAGIYRAINPSFWESIERA